MFPVHRTASTVQGDPCWPSLGQLPEPVERLLVVTAPTATEAVVKEAAAAGIRQVWLQQGASSAAAIKACEEQGLQVVDGQLHPHVRGTGRVPRVSPVDVGPDREDSEGTEA